MTTRIARVPLRDRGIRGEWTEFESVLFNLVTEESKQYETEGRLILFSTRLAITQSMLDAFDSYFEGTVQ